MAKVLINEDILQDTADAIRTKTGKNNGIKPSNFSQEISNISSGGGVSINGSIKQKIACGIVSEGDFVAATETPKITRVKSESDYALDGGIAGAFTYSVRDILDDDDTTSGYVQNSADMTPTNIFTRMPNCETLGIPKSSLIFGYKVRFKYYCEGSSSLFSQFSCYGYRYKENEFPTTSLSQGGTNITYSNEPIEAEFSYNTIIKAEDMHNYGTRIRFGNTNMQGSRPKLHLYYIEYEIVYLDKNTVKTVMADTDQIVGIAKDRGFDGDTIDVFVPYAEEGV